MWLLLPAAMLARRSGVRSTAFAGIHWRTPSVGSWRRHRSRLHAALLRPMTPPNSNLRCSAFTVVNFIIDFFILV